MDQKEENQVRLTEVTEVPSVQASEVHPVLEEPSLVPILDERYQILKEIGSGGMGTVFKVRDIALDKTFAVKRLHKNLVTDQIAIKRFQQEVLAASALTHPNLIAVYDNGVADDGAPYLVMDYLEGESLTALIGREGYLDHETVLDIFIQVCEAMSHAHQKGLLHRDLKPSNIFITRTEAGQPFVKIVDFGIVKMLPSTDPEEADITRTGEIFGSPCYMSPEQCQGDDVDVRSDVYALGCVMYEALTGKPPFLGANPVKTIIKHLQEKPIELRVAARDLGIPKSIEAIVLHCLEKEPSGRYSSVDELRNDLVLVQDNKAPLVSALHSPKCLGLQPKQLGRRVVAVAIDAVLLTWMTCIVTVSFVIPLYMTLGGNQLPSLILGALTAPFANPALYVMELLDASFNLAWLFAVSFPFLLNYTQYGSHHYNWGDSSLLNMYTVLLNHPLVRITAVSLVATICNWLYHANGESSALQATPGKWLCGLKVTDDSGQRIGFWQASARHFSKTIFALLVVDIIRFVIYWSKAKSISAAFKAVVRKPAQDFLSRCLISRSATGPMKLLKAFRFKKQL